MGLLDNIDGDTILSGLLSAGAASGAKGPYLARVAAGLAQGERFRQARSQEEMQKEYRDLQVKKLNMEMKQAEAAAAKQAKISQWTERLLGGDTSPGAFQTPVDGRGPVMPPSRSGIANASLDQVAGLHALGGPNLMDAYKFANTPQSFAAGSTMINPVTREQTVIPKLPDGMRMGASGMAEEIPGFGAANAGIEGAKASAQEAARAALDMVAVPQSDGSTRMMPRAQAVKMSQGDQPQATPGMQNLGGNLSPALQAFIASDAAKNGIANPIARIGQPGQNMALSSEPALGVSQSPAAATRARAAAEADAAREASNAKDAKLGARLMSSADRAISLLGQNPTESGIGTMVDAVASKFGKTPKGAAVADQLRTLSGWMVSNVPRMEGPQSNFDVANYQTMAGIVGDSTVPIERRLAAAHEVKRLQEKYAELNGVTPSEQPKPAAMEALPPAQQHKGRTIRDTSTGKTLVSNGMSWVEKK